MGQALYRKYRSKSLQEVVGQEHITKTLEQALKSGRISHAYLLTGPRGTGKTSVARILAHKVNGLSYTDDSSHIDIIEIDAASNRRIDEIRELREKVYVAPTSAKYKVYIIDEVHMLTREAFNALLKTLEEPPAHVIFILATTDAHKLPETIISRTQRFTFKPVEPDKVAAHLKHIAEQEQIDISDEALALLARHGEGSFRDSISLLDQAGARGTKLEADDILALLGIPPDAALERLLAAIAAHDPASTMLQLLSELYGQGYQAAAIAKQLGQLLRRQLTDGDQPRLPAAQTLALLRELIEVSAASDPERLLEIILLQAAQAEHNNLLVPAAPSQPPANAPKEAAVTSPAALTKQVNRSIQPTATPEPLPSTTAAELTAPADHARTVAALDAAIWPTILEALKRQHNTLYGIVRMGRPEFAEDGIVKLFFGFPFHQKRINEPKNRQLLTQVIEQTAGQRAVVECLVDKRTGPPPAAALTPPQVLESGPTADLTTISNIFGGGELLES